MRILYLLQAVQHPTMRGSLRHYRFLRYLAQHHRITLIALNRTPLTDAARDELAQQTDHAFIFEDATPDGAARIVRRLHRERTLRRMKREFGGLATPQDFDVVLVHGRIVCGLVRGFTALPVVIDLCDASAMRQRLRAAHSQGIDRLLHATQHAWLLRLERDLVRQTPHLAFISERDRAAVTGSTRIGEVIPNGLDTAYWTRSGGERQPHTIIFTGVMDYAPNEDAALFLMDSVVPRVRASLPQLEVLIVGRSPRPRLIAAAERCGGVTVTGYVEDMRPWLERSTVFAAPLRFSAGMQNKVLEAMAMEVPVVTTPVVADGLRVGDAGPPIETAGTAAELADGVLALLADSATRMRLGAAGRAYVREHFDWERSGRLLETLCLSAAAAPERARAGVVA